MHTTGRNHCLALHNVGHTAEGDAFAEEDPHPQQEVVEGFVYIYMLYRALYPQVHKNGVKKEKKGRNHFAQEPLKSLSYHYHSPG
jgi:hypothetical protein